MDQAKLIVRQYRDEWLESAEHYKAEHRRALERGAAESAQRFADEHDRAITRVITAIELLNRFENQAE